MVGYWCLTPLSIVNFDFESTYCRLFQKHVVLTKLVIYIFISTIFQLYRHCLFYKLINEGRCFSERKNYDGCLQVAN
jgi:hypothetical protein